MIVLDECHVPAEDIVKSPLVEALEKEAAFVAENVRRQHQRVAYEGGDFHMK
jgi:hypothetical protein